jgi:hypothetical protein
VGTNLDLGVSNSSMLLHIRVSIDNNYILYTSKKERILKVFTIKK